MGCQRFNADRSGNWIWDESDESDEPDEPTDVVEKRKFTKDDLIDMIANPSPNSVLANLARAQYASESYLKTLDFLKSCIN